MPKNPKKLKSENNFKIEGFFGNMMKDSKKKKDTEILEEYKIAKNKIENFDEEKKEIKKKKSPEKAQKIEKKKLN